MQDFDDWTPLHFAAKFNNAPAAKLLLEAGADLEAEDHKWNSTIFQHIQTRERPLLIAGKTRVT